MGLLVSMDGFFLISFFFSQHIGLVEDFSGYTLGDLGMTPSWNFAKVKHFLISQHKGLAKISSVTPSLV